MTLLQKEELARRFALVLSEHNVEIESLKKVINLSQFLLAYARFPEQHVQENASLRYIARIAVEAERTISLPYSYN